MLKIDIPKSVTNIINKLNDNGFEAYIVGGCVRDYILGKEPKDWDITTSAYPEEVKKLFNRTYDTGIKHGTITINDNGINYEVTTYRIDGNYIDNRHPESVKFTKNINEDLSRRDFTMNAIAYHEKYGFIDPFNGIDDINNKIIRGVGNPSKRFDEDALRMIRAVRFSAQLNFDIEEKTFNALKEKAKLIENISIERIHDELIKLLNSKNPEKIAILEETKILYYSVPLLNEKYKNSSKEIIKILKILSKNEKKSSAIFMSVFLINSNEKEAKQIMKTLKFDTKTLKEACILSTEIKNKIPSDLYEIRKIISKIGKENFKNLIILSKALYKANNNHEMYKNVCETEKKLNKILKNADCCSLKDLNIDGNDLKKEGVKNGIEIGNLLNKALEYILHNPDKNNKKDILSFLNKYI